MGSSILSVVLFALKSKKISDDHLKKRVSLSTKI